MLETSLCGIVLYDLCSKLLKPCIINIFNFHTCDTVRINKSTQFSTKPVCKCLKICLKVIQFVRSFPSAIVLIAEVVSYVENYFELCENILEKYHMEHWLLCGIACLWFRSITSQTFTYQISKLDEIWIAGLLNRKKIKVLLF